MSHLRHLSISKINRIWRAARSRVQQQPREAWIFVIGLNLVGLIGTLTTYPGAILVTAAVTIVVVLEDEKQI